MRGSAPISVPAFQKTYLFGWPDREPTTNEPYPPQSYQYFLNWSIEYMEDLLDISILPRTVTNEPHDYHFSDYMAWCLIHAWHYPIQAVTQVAGQFPTSPDLLVLPVEWVVPELDSGVIQLIPTSGTIASYFIGTSSLFLPLLQQGGGYIPGFWRINYTAGFPENCIPRDIVHAYSMLAACACADILGDILGGTGVLGASVGLDGASQFISLSKSATTNALYSRILSYRTTLFGASGMAGPGSMIHTLKRKYHGIGVINL